MTGAYSNFKRQVVQLLQSDHAAGWVNCGQKLEYDILQTIYVYNIFNHCDVTGL